MSDTSKLSAVHPNTFKAVASLDLADSTAPVRYFRLAALEDADSGDAKNVKESKVKLSRLPYSLRILLENLLRREDGVTVTPEDIRFLAAWDPKAEPSREIAYMPARVLMQDFTGVPAIVDLAAMRDAMKALGGSATDIDKINPLVPAELVIDHSVQVDEYGTASAYDLNAALEFQRNRERYAFLKWGQTAFHNFSAVPPGMGICHQVNLEYLARVTFTTPPAGDGSITAYPDTLVGTDSHTTMVNGLGVLGWGVGGIEAEAAMLGQPVSMLVPQVVGFKLMGKLREGTTATDLVLTVTEMLRKLGVVGKFVEFYGPGISELPLADRATIANMAPEYGATCGIFPVDHETLKYLRLTGRSESQIALCETYYKAQGLFHTPDAPEAEYSALLELDLGTVQPSVAGPKRPQDRVLLKETPASFAKVLPTLIAAGANRTAERQMVRWEGEGGHVSASGDVTSGTGQAFPAVPDQVVVLPTIHLSTEEILADRDRREGVPAARDVAAANRNDTEAPGSGTMGTNAAHLITPVVAPAQAQPAVQQPGAGAYGGPLAAIAEPIHTVQDRFGVDPDRYLRDGSIVIAAITSCTNTSNPYVMMAAGLLAKKAVQAGLQTPPWVKTSLAPGSRVVTDYYMRSGLLQYLDALRFQVVGYGCTTCIGNSGPLPTDVSKSIEDHGLVAVSVLSGNRNFEGRISPEVRANYLMSPPLVVAYALAGHIEHNFDTEPLGRNRDGQAVYLRDIWPTQQEVSDTVHNCIDSTMFRHQYSTVSDGDANWQHLKFPSGETYGWEADSTYIRKAPYFDAMTPLPEPVADIVSARCLAWLGDSVTTDHISPAGSIKLNGPAGKYLTEHGVKPFEFNSYGSRRGNHEVMVRGTFANVRLRNKLAPGTEGGVTRLLPSGDGMSIYDASVRYAEGGVPLCILAGKEYGSGSSRDWAAKGPKLLGIRFVIAESYERIHRSNLVGMGILPLQFQPGEGAESYGLTGEELFTLGESGELRTMLENGFATGKNLTVTAITPAGETLHFPATLRIDTPQEILYYQHGGILQYVLRQLAGKA